MSKHLVLIGAGHAHMVLIHNIARILERGHEVTVIGPSPHHYYSGMGPGMLGGTYAPEQIRFDSKRLVEQQGATFLEDRVVHIDGAARSLLLESGGELAYDVLSCNCGSGIELDFGDSLSCPLYPVKPIENLLVARNQIREMGRNAKLSIGIVGGGPSAAELAGNILWLARRERLARPKVRLYCRSRFMARFPLDVRNGCRKHLRRVGVEIFENDPVVTFQEQSLQTAGGRDDQVDMVFVASGVRPSRLFLASGLPTGADGGLVVNDFLQSSDHPEIFGGGDCIYFQSRPLDKVGVYAVRQNPVLLHNVMATLDNQPLKHFDPGGGYLLIFNLGGGYGVLKKGALFWKGRLAFRVKDYIDRKFMRRFQELPQS